MHVETPILNNIARKLIWVHYFFPRRKMKVKEEFEIWIHRAVLILSPKNFIQTEVLYIVQKKVKRKRNQFSFLQYSTKQSAKELQQWLLDFLGR